MFPYPDRNARPSPGAGTTRSLLPSYKRMSLYTSGIRSVSILHDCTVPVLYERPVLGLDNPGPSIWSGTAPDHPTALVHRHRASRSWPVKNDHPWMKTLTWERPSQSSNRVIAIDDMSIQSGILAFSVPNLSWRSLICAW